MMMMSRCPRLDYMELVELYSDIESLRQAIVTTIWNDDRLLREDIKCIANELLNELKRG